MGRRSMVIAGAVLLIACGDAPVEVTCGATTTRFEGASVRQVDGAFELTAFEVSGERFVPVGACGVAGDTIDLAGSWVTPPFGEAHTHKIESSFVFDAFNEQFLEAGVYYARNPNVYAPYAQELRERLAEPGTIDVTFSMGGVTAPYGHPEGGYVIELTRVLYPGFTRGDLVGEAFHPVASEADIAPAIAALVEDGADFVKVFLHRSEDHDSLRALVTPELVADGLNYAAGEYMFGLDPDLVAPVVAAANGAGLEVGAHVSTREDFAVAVSAGVDMLLHAPGIWAPSSERIDAQRLRPEDAAAAGAAGVTVAPTYAARLELTPEALREELYAMQRANVELLREAGVPLHIGIDNYGAPTRTEIDHLIAIGAMTPEQALDAWIATGPAIFPERRLGAIEPGFEADFLVFASDPRRDAGASASITARWKSGRPLTP